MGAMHNVLFQLKTFFDPYFKSTLSDWRILEGYIFLAQFKKRTMIKAAGEREHFLRFILEGGGAMQIKQGKKEICFDLCFEGNFLTDFESLNGGGPTNIQIRSFEPVKAVVINRNSLFRLYTATSLGTEIRRVLAEQQNRRNHQNFIEYLGKTTEERYRKLLQERPELLLRTPQHYVASYLGVSTENLSRVRRRMGKG